MKLYVYVTSMNDGYLKGYDWSYIPREAELGLWIVVVVVSIQETETKDETRLIFANVRRRVDLMYGIYVYVSSEFVR
jgi:hypothetical protein